MPNNFKITIFIIGIINISDVQENDMTIQLFDLLEELDEEKKEKTDKLLYDLREDIIDHTQALIRLTRAIESKNKQPKTIKQ